MRDEWSDFVEREMMKDIERTMEEINADPLYKDVEAPEALHDVLFAQIREYEEQRVYAQLSDADKELIRLGKVYQRKRKWKKYLVVIAAVIAVLALGTVCIGKDENVFRAISEILHGKERTTVDSGETEIITHLDEYEAYEKVEEKYGFAPVELEYLPIDTVFREATFSEEIQSINLIYETKNGNSIVYVIRPNYREASLGTVIEDEKIQEYQMDVSNVEISLSEYNIEDTDENRWSVSFVYQDVQYLLWVNNIEQQEVEKIVNSLNFRGGK